MVPSRVWGEYACLTYCQYASTKSLIIKVDLGSMTARVGQPQANHSEVLN